MLVKCQLSSAFCEAKTSTKLETSDPVVLYVQERRVVTLQTVFDCRAETKCFRHWTQELLDI